MNAFRQWFQTMTMGQTKKYMKLLAWSLFGSFGVSIPYAVCSYKNVDNFILLRYNSS